MTLLVLVRHGESQWNVERRVQGQDGPGLSPRGEEQAILTARWLAESYPQAQLVTSDLLRCVDTITPLAEVLGRDVAIDPGLRERDFGRWSGVLAEELPERDPDLVRRWRGGEDVIAEVGGEGDAAFTDRVVRSLRAVAARPAVGNVVVCCTHGGPIWHGTRAMVGVASNVLGPVANCSITELRLDDERPPRLFTWNQVAHLPVALRTWIVDANAAAGAARRDASSTGAVGERSRAPQG